MKFRTYSSASVADGRVSFSVYKRSYPRSRCCFCRSSSPGVKPKRVARSASVSSASSARSTAPSLAVASSMAASFERTKMRRLAVAVTNGVFGWPAMSWNRLVSIAAASHSTMCCRYTPTLPCGRSGSLQ